VRKAAFDFDPHAAAAAAQAGSFTDVAENWIKHYVERKKLRAKNEIARQLNAYVYPRWAQTPFFEIRRKTVNKLLDNIEEENGAPQADGVSGDERLPW